jgi:hypothetical protein
MAEAVAVGGAHPTGDGMAEAVAVGGAHPTGDAGRWWYTEFCGSTSFSVASPMRDRRCPRAVGGHRAVYHVGSSK